MTSLGSSSVSSTSSSMNDRLKLIICGSIQSCSMSANLIVIEKLTSSIECYQYHLVNREDDAGKGDEDPELWGGGDPGESVQHAEDVEEDVELVRQPEEAVRLLPDQRVREQEDDAHHGVKHYAWGNKYI